MAIVDLGAITPQVNDGTLTIKKNNENIAQFTANQAAGVTADIFTHTYETAARHYKIVADVNTTIKFINYMFELTAFTDATPTWNIPGKAILNRDQTPTLTMASNGGELNINSTGFSRGIILSNKEITITTSATSTPEANAVPTVNLY